jgi:hypothetical protein
VRKQFNKQKVRTNGEKEEKCKDGRKEGRREERKEK